MNKYNYIIIITIITIIIILNYVRIFELVYRTFIHPFILLDHNLIKKEYYDYTDEKIRNQSIIYKEIYDVPNNIFQIYIHNDKIPLEIIENIKSIKYKNSEWKYYLITDENVKEWLDNINDPIFNKIYFDISDEYPAAKSDLLRYLLMKHYGGVYLDIKSGSKFSLYTLIKPKVMLFKWCAIHTGLVKACFSYRRKRKYVDELVQWLLIYPKGHYFIDAVLNNIQKKYEEYKNDKKLFQDIYGFTGPDIYTDTIIPLTNDKNAIIYPNTVDLGFIYSVLKYHHKCYSKSKHYLDIKKRKIIN